MGVAMDQSGYAMLQHDFFDCLLVDVHDGFGLLPGL